jgi:hypothetical protein
MQRATQTTTVRPPRQARSERTLERILSAAEELAAQRPFDEIARDRDTHDLAVVRDTQPHHCLNFLRA